MQSYKERVKQRIIASNEAVNIGLPADPWVLEYREKNNKIKANWKAKQPKSTYIPKANSGSFKSGMIPKNKLTDEQKKQSIIKARERTRKWHRENKDRVNLYRRNKRLNDPSFRILCNIRKRLSFLVREHSTVKTEQTLKYLGCSLDFLLSHLSSQFKEGMSFDNYGKWHIDHKIPCNYFDLTKESQLEKCFHYTNLQPLWAIENRIKSDKILGFIQI